MNILGISCYYHDSAAALLQDGLLVAAAEEERFSRQKHDSGYPKQAIQFCLDRAGITAAELDYVVFYEKPFLKFERILLSSLARFPKTWAFFREAMVTWFDEKLWVKSRLQTEIGVPTDKILFVEHHLSHAASAMFCAPFEEAAVLTVDGVGEWTTATMGRATATFDGSGSNAIHLSQEMRFPHSLGLLYSVFTAFLGFRVNNGEYKVMGMAPYGEPAYLDLLDKIVSVDQAGGVQLNMDYFSFHYSAQQRGFNDRFVELFGAPREPEADFYTPTTNPARDYPGWNENRAIQNQKYANIAASIQRFSEETILKMVNAIQAETGSKNLVMAGGVALNSVANGRIIREGPFDNVFIQPAAGDSGGALGAALYAYHVLLGQPRKFVMDHAYWGADYTEAEMAEAIQKSGFPYEQLDDQETLLDRATDTLLAERVISWFQGRFEWGPRALGHRSILADPRRERMKEVVNTKIKFRSLRPFAPVITAERAAEYFATKNIDHNYLAPYMLMVSPVVSDKQDKIQAVCHNGTGRLQSVRQDINAPYYRLIEKFAEATGVPVLLNTSFNLRGEPIVNTPQNALNTFAKSDIDQLIMGNFLVKKP